MRFDTAPCVAMFIGLLLVLTCAPARSGELPAPHLARGLCLPEKDLGAEGNSI
jgi:hypothetical protein